MNRDQILKPLLSELDRLYEIEEGHIEPQEFVAYKIIRQQEVNDFMNN